MRVILEIFTSKVRQKFGLEPNKNLSFISKIISYKNKFFLFLTSY